MIKMNKYAIIFALTLLIPITAAQTTNIQMELKTTEPTPLQTSEYADIWLEATNKGSTPARNVEINFTENYPFTVDRDEEKNWEIEEITPGEEYQIHLQAKIDENAVEGENNLEFRVTSEKTSFIEKVPVEIRTDRNVLSIQNINFPEKVAPGTQSNMSIKLANLADSQLKNIEIGLELSDKLPMATSNAADKNLAKINSGETKTINYTINVDESAENSVYKLPIQTNFENTAGTEFQQSTTTGINVGGKPILEPGLNTEEKLSVGKTTEMTFRLVNKGHGPADFVELELKEGENYEVVGTNDVYIGSMDSDDFQTATFTIHTKDSSRSVSADEINFPIQITYRDQDGKQNETKTVEAELYTAQELRKYGITSQSSIIPVIAAMIIIAIAIIYYWRKKKV